MKTIAILGVPALALSACGGQVGQFIQKETGLTPGQQIGLALKVPCIVSNAALLASQVQHDIAPTQPADPTTSKVLVSSTDVCTGLGGIITASK